MWQVEAYVLLRQLLATLFRLALRANEIGQLHFKCFQGIFLVELDVFTVIVPVHRLPNIIHCTVHVLVLTHRLS